LALAAGLLVLSLAGATAQERSNGADPAALDRHLYASLADVINHGARVFNSNNDHAGCYRIYEGALLTIRPLLRHRPQLQLAIDAGLAQATRTRTWSDGAFALREVLDKIRDEVYTRPPDKKDLVEKKHDPPPTDDLARVTGRVVMEGLALGDAEVQLASRDDPDQEPSVGRTAADGRVDFKPVRPGSYVVLVVKRVQKDGMTRNLVLERYGDRTLSPLRVELARGSNHFAFDLKPEPEKKEASTTLKVRGRIVAEGKPLAGAEIRLVPEDDLGAEGYRVMLDADGTFTVEVKPGRYVGVVVKATVPVPDAWRDAKRSPNKYDFTKVK
jgi:hypothetical protein